MKLNASARATLKAVLAEPTPANIAWKDLERLLVALGAQLVEGRGSRLRVTLGGRRAVVHRPHPRKEAGRAAVRALRDFLQATGIDVDELQGLRRSRGV